MATVYSLEVIRMQAIGTRPGGTDTPAILMIPNAYNLTLYAIGSAAASCKIEETYSTAESISTGIPAAVWMSVDASLDSVGTTSVRYLLGDRTPCALRVTALGSGQTATLVLVGKR